MNKQGWEVKKLGEICEILDSQRRPITKKDRQSGRYPYFGATGIQDYVADYIFDGSFVLVGEDGAKWGANDRTAFLVEGKCWVNNHAHVLKIKEEIIDRWVIYYLNHKNLNEYITGAVVPKLNQASLRNIPIPVPTFSIQEQIVKELDKLSEIIEKKKKQLAELDSLTQSTFHEMFGDPVKNEKGWEIRRLEELGGWASGGTPSRNNLSYFKGSIPWVTSGELNFLFINDTIEHINEEAIRNSNAKLIRKGSLLLGMYDTAALKSAINKREMACNQAIAFSFLNTKLCNTIYVYYSIQINKEEYKKEQRGIRQKNLNLSMIKAIAILYPPLLLQNQFAKRIEKIEQQKALIEQSIVDVQQLFDSAMDKYFH